MDGYYFVSTLGLVSFFLDRGFYLIEPLLVHQLVLAWPAHEYVISFSSANDVGSKSAGQSILAFAAPDAVLALAAKGVVIAIACRRKKSKEKMMVESNRIPERAG